MSILFGICLLIVILAVVEPGYTWGTRTYFEAIKAVIKFLIWLAALFLAVACIVYGITQLG